MPISEPIDIGANFGLNNTTTKSPSKSERTVTSFGGNIKGDYDLIDFDLSHSLSTSTTKGDNTKSESSTSKIAITYAGEESTTSLSAAMSSFKPKSGVTATTDLGINWSKELTIFGEEFGIDLGASSSEKTRVPLSAEGSILKQMALKLELDHSFGAGLTGSLTTNFIQIGSLPVLKDDTISDGPPEVLATGDAKQFILLFKYAPVSFAAASVAYDYTDRMLRVSDQNFKLKLLKNNFGQRTVTSINLSLNYKF